MADLTVFIQSERLSDNSEVFNVFIGKQKMAAVTEKDAYWLADKIAAAIEQHTVSTCDIVE